MHPPAASVTRKVAYNTGIQLAGKVVITLIAAVSVGVLTRYLGPSGYGMFTTALVFLQVFSIFADLGLFTVVVKRISQDESQTERTVGNAMALRGLLSVVTMLVAIGIGLMLPYTPDVKVGIIIASTSLIFGLLNSSLLTVFQARLRMDYGVLSDLAGRLLALIAVLVVVKLNLGFYAVVATAAVGNFVSLLVTWYFARRFVRVRFLGDTRFWKELFFESLPYGITIAITFIYFRLDTFLLSLLRSPAEVGVYGAAFKVIEILLTVPGFFVNSVFPVLAKYVGSGDSRTRGLVQQSFDVLLMLGIPIATGAIILGGPIIKLVAGDQFVGSSLALQLQAPGVIFAFANLLLGTMIVAKGRFRAMMTLSFIILVFNVVINLVTIPMYGFRAAAVNTAVTEGLVFVSTYWLCRRFYGFGPSFRALPRLALAAAVMALAVWYVKPLGLLPAILVGMLVYGLGTYLFHGPARMALELVVNKGRTK